MCPLGTKNKKGTGKEKKARGKMPLHFNFLYQEYPNNILGTNFYWIICITFKSFQTKLKCPRNVSEKASGTST